jgi:hypothetical protein
MSDHVNIRLNIRIRIVDRLHSRDNYIYWWNLFVGQSMPGVLMSNHLLLNINMIDWEVKRSRNRIIEAFP